MCCWLNKAFVLLLISFVTVSSFSSLPKPTTILQYIRSRSRSSSTGSSIIKLSSTDLSIEQLHLTPVLTDYAERLRKVNDDKLRYQQLLFLAAKCPAMDDALKVDANKVPGCLSVVHVHAQKDPVTNSIIFQADSDSQLTKGLVAMLVNGLSGHSAADILLVRPEFIQYAGVGKSLTPGRNNGFLNMLNTMKRKAQELSPEAAETAAATAASTAAASATTSDAATTSASSSDSTAVDSAAKETNEQSAAATTTATTAAAATSSTSALTADSTGNGPMFQSIVQKLSMLQPVLLHIDDDSHKHAGHAGIATINNHNSSNNNSSNNSSSSSSGETHFSVRVVAACFAGLSRVQRHKMIYALLQQELQGGVHALSISASTPDEV